MREENERIKLTANYLSGLGVAVAAIGGLAPIVSRTFDSNPGTPLWVIAVVSVICLLISVGLDLLARWTLGRLSE